MNNVASQLDLIKELKRRGFQVKSEGTLVYFDIAPETGHCRSYSIDFDRATHDWQVNLSEITYDSKGDDNEEQTFLGNFASASDIADAIEEHENDL